MKIIFIGSVEFSLNTLKAIIDQGGDVVGICTLKESSFNADFCDLNDFAQSKNIPCLYIEDINSQKSINWISKFHPDVVFCFGWSRLLKKELLSIAPLGVIGFHPAALPVNRGRHPIIWAIALELKETASTFFFMDEGADTGDIISQKRIEISKTDNAGTLYNRLTELAINQIKEFLPLLQKKSFERIKQDHSLANTWRKRTSKDGIIDWRMNANVINNLVRALTKPYIGAEFTYKNVQYKVWQSEVLPSKFQNDEPGKVVDVRGDSSFIKCADGIIHLVSIEPKLIVKKGDYL
tara:strand:- start:4288 stop:5169 length:882 start_codon:yes stop_codon:yes gene_type:complete